ncbi:energy-coupled thiamine transporter ThiT [Virgibacillus senegalensis]|uniref:energy-coupled thiamine transporter ThiT n=1 Tax=Virgibacillus senegalensis TaxID=1499679 RepID=UPI00069EEBAA|nr:energy-coupled thiamine transporter ThiT [Virgibacillus senegalensis]
MNSKQTLFLVEVAIMSALALVLDIVPFLSFKIWPQGGSVSFAMIPVFLVAFRWGLKGGLLSGLLFGIFQVVIGTAYILTPLQGLIEYGLAFTVLGAAGVVSNKVQSTLKVNKYRSFFVYVSLGVLLGCLLRFFGHVAAGVVFFAEYAPEGQPVWLYSVIYNGSFMLPAFILSSIIIGFLLYKQPRLVLVRR